MAGIEDGSRHEYVAPEDRPIIARMAWLSRLTLTIQTSLVPVADRDIRSPHERFLDDQFEFIRDEAADTAPPWMTLDTAIRSLIDERFERGILSRDEHDELIRRMAILPPIDTPPPGSMH